MINVMFPPVCCVLVKRREKTFGIFTNVFSESSSTTPGQRIICSSMTVHCFEWELPWCSVNSCTNSSKPFLLIYFKRCVLECWAYTLCVAGNWVVRYVHCSFASECMPVNPPRRTLGVWVFVFFAVRRSPSLPLSLSARSVSTHFLSLPNHSSSHLHKPRPIRPSPSPRPLAPPPLHITVGQLIDRTVLGNRRCVWIGFHRAVDEPHRLNTDKTLFYSALVFYSARG